MLPISQVVVKTECDDTFQASSRESDTVTT